MPTTLEELIVKYKVDLTELEDGARRAGVVMDGSATRMKSSLAGLKSELMGLLPAFSVAALATFGKQAIAEADHINDLALRVGVLGSTLSALNVPLRQSGSSLDEFASTLVRMNNLLGEADKNPEAVKTFNELGLSITKLKQLNPEQQFYAIAQALAQIKDQGEFTALGINIFGRSFAVIAPLIRQAGGDLEGFVEQQKKAGNAISDDDLKRIDEFGDKWTESVEKLKLAMLNAVPALKLYLDGLAGILNLAGNAEKAGRQIGEILSGQAAYTQKAKSMGFVTEPTIVNGYTIDANGNLVPPKPKQSLSGHNAMPAKDDKKLEAQDYDTLTDSVDEYTRKLEVENELLGMNEREREGMRSVFEAQNLALKDGNILTEEQIEQIKALGEAHYDLQQKITDSETASRRMRENLVDGLNDIALHFDSASSAANRFFENIASQIITKKISTPFADSLMGLFDSSGFGSFFKDIFGGARASGGPVSAGKAYVVGENRPEIFVPNTSGMIYPSVGGGGGGVSVTNVFNISPGIQGTVRAELMNALPGVQSQIQASVFRAIERGGSEARLVGRKS